MSRTKSYGATYAKKAEPFDLQAWSLGMDIVLGTKVHDPLVRFSERHMSPVRVCGHCGVSFTPLGLTRHIPKCRENPTYWATKPALVKLRRVK